MFLRWIFGLILGGVCLGLPSLVMATEPPDSGALEEPAPAWIGEAVALARDIEARDLLATPERVAAFDRLVEETRGERRLDLLMVQAWHSLTTGNPEEMLPRISRYRTEAGSNDSAWHAQTGELIALLGESMVESELEAAAVEFERLLAGDRLDLDQRIIAAGFLAVCYSFATDDSQALEPINRAQAWLDQQPDVHPFTRASFASARTLVMMGTRDYPRVLKAMRQEVVDHQAMELPYDGSSLLYNLAFILNEAEDHEAAREVVEIFDRATLRAGSEEDRFYAKILCAGSAQAREDVAGELQCLLEAEEYLHLVPDRRLSTLLNIADLHAQLGHVDQAQAYLDRVLAAEAPGEEFKDAIELVRLELLHAQRRSREAYEGLRALRKKEHVARDEQLEVFAAELRRMSEADEARLAEREALLEREAALQDQVIGRQRTIVALAFLLLFFAMGFALVQARNSRRLRRANAAALAAASAKSEFLANISHEIRTPMNGVLGMAELLQDSDLNEDQQMYAETIYKSGSALLTVINDVLDFSKIEAGRMELDPVPTDLHAVVDDVAALLSRAAADKSVELLTRMDPALPRGVKVDGGRLRQVLTNLVGNAVKFTERGHVLLEVTGHSDGSEVELRFHIRDTGIGIPRHKLESVFEQFTQAEGSTTRRFGGTGLGLSITRSLVESMGGRVSVESREGDGSTFTVELRLPTVALSAAATDVARLPERARILILDDLEVSRLIFEETLNNWGLEFQSVHDPQEALELLQDMISSGRPEERFDLVLSDYNMPGMDGAQWARAVRQHPELARLPIIITTSSDIDVTRHAFEGIAVSSVLAKPVRQSLLRREISQALGVAAPEQVPAPATVVDEAPRVIEDGETVRLLLAEDNPVNRMIVQRMLEPERFDADTVENGREAFEAVRGGDYDLVLMDVSMPEMDGVEATQAIRELERELGRPRMPIIALTAHAMEGDRERFLDAGMDDYLTKPLTRDQLRETMARWTERRK